MWFKKCKYTFNLAKHSQNICCRKKTLVKRSDAIYLEIARLS